MPNDKHADSDRPNALRSRGPKTAKGKAASRPKRINHIALSKRLLMPGESPVEFLELSHGFGREYQPQGPAECMMVETIIRAAWSLRRITIRPARYPGQDEIEVYYRCAVRLLETLFGAISQFEDMRSARDPDPLADASDWLLTFGESRIGRGVGPVNAGDSNSELL